MNDYSFVRHGRLVTVYGYGLSESDACGGSFDELDSHTELIREYLGIQGASGYTFRWFSNVFWEAVSPCSADAFACAPHDGAMSRNLPDMHEMLHVIMDSEDGCASVLEEGLAEYFHGPTPWEWYPPPDYGIEQLLAYEQIPRTPDAYTLAAHFISFLIESYGPETVAQLCRKIPRENTIVIWDSAMRRVLGNSLDQVLAQYAAYPVCSSEQVRARLWVCGGELDFTFSSENDSFVVDAGCSDARATNAAWGYIGNAVLQRLVYFPDDTWVEVSARSLGESGTGATYVSQECAPCSADPQVLVELDAVDVQFYRAGYHEVSVFFDKRDPIRLTMTRLP